MASSLLRLTRPTVSAFRLLSIHGGRPSEQRNPFHAFDQQCYTITTASPLNRAWLKSQLSEMPLVAPALYTLEANQLTVQAPGWNKTETDQGLCLTLHMPGLEPEDVDATIDGNHLVIQGQTDDTAYQASMELPPNFIKNRNFRAAMKDTGVFKLTLPMVEYQMANFHRASWRIINAAAWCDLIFNHPPYRRNVYSSMVLDHLGANFMSFTLYKKVTAESVFFKVSRGVVKMESANEGLYVSLIMPGLETEDVMCYFEDDLFIIDGKKETEHYICGVRVPDGYEKKNDNMIKAEMNGGIYKATLPRVGGAN